VCRPNCADFPTAPKNIPRHIKVAQPVVKEERLIKPNIEA
jgi:hypothetical protein